MIPNSNFDLALIRYLFVRLQEYSEILNKEKTAYEEILSKLDEIAVIDGYIGLNRVERLKESHRHFSHLMCLYPLHLIHYDTKEHRELYKKALSEIETRNWNVGRIFVRNVCTALCYGREWSRRL